MTGLATKWSSPVDTQERERLRERPKGPAVMRQTWLDLLFLHFPVEPAELAHLIPDCLEPDLFPDASGEPRAWVGVVAFRIEGIRLLGLPSFPGLGSFDEINVRTYVHRRGGADPSVLFLSLDGGPFVTRLSAGAWYKVPYFRSKTQLQEVKDELLFESQRPGEMGRSRLRFRPGEALPVAQPGSLEHFLLERYQLLAPSHERLYGARVWHEPYRPQSVELLEAETDLTACHGIRMRPFVHACTCRCVEAEFFAPHRLA